MSSSGSSKTIQGSDYNEKWSCAALPFPENQEPRAAPRLGAGPAEGDENWGRSTAAAKAAVTAVRAIRAQSRESPTPVNNRQAGLKTALQTSDA